MKAIDLCEANALQPFVQYLEKRGVNAEKHLERQRIPPELVQAGAGKIIKQQAWRFFADVQRREGMDDLGFIGGASFDMDDLGPLGRAVQQAETLLGAIQTFARLVPSFAEGNTVWLESTGDPCRLFCHTARLDPTAQVPDHYTVLILIGLVRLAAGADWRPEEILFQSNPSDVIHRLEVTGDIQARFRQKGSGIAFSRPLLAQPVRTSGNGDADTSLSSQRSSSTGSGLIEVLESMVPHIPLPSAQEMAEMAGMSRATLARRLQEEGVSYRHLVERVRYAEAVRLLNEGDRTKEIADQLGYASPSNFVRAFQRMSGTTPGRYRDRGQSLGTRFLNPARFDGWSEP